jgi:LL-diaminopimelate aminotransferase
MILYQPQHDWEDLSVLHRNREPAHATLLPYADAAAALTGDQSWTIERNEIYKLRRDLIVSSMRQAGFTVQTPPAAIYVWARLPEGITDSTDFCSRLLDETGVSITPGVVYGKAGEGYVRISLGTPTHRMEEAMQRLKEIEV